MKINKEHCIDLANRIEKATYDDLLNLDLEIANTFYQEEDMGVLVPYKDLFNTTYRMVEWSNRPNSSSVLEEFTSNPQHILEVLPNNTSFHISGRNYDVEASVFGYPKGKWVMARSIERNIPIAQALCSAMLRAYATWTY